MFPDQLLTFIYLFKKSLVVIITTGLSPSPQKTAEGLHPNRILFRNTTYFLKFQFVTTASRSGSGAHPASYPMGSRGSFLGVEAAGA
jgi:hypothetical protein